MKIAQQVAQHLRDVYFGDNWTSVNMQDTLADVTWQEATTRLYNLNTIAALVYHTSYYLTAALAVLQGAPLTAKDIYSFDHPPIHSAEDWQKQLHKTRVDVEKLASLIEQMPEEAFGETFAQHKYGSNYRNLHGIVEHTHYHLGQMVLVKKLLRQDATTIKNIAGAS